MQEIVYAVKFDNGQFAWTEQNENHYIDVWTVKDIGRAALYPKECIEKTFADMVKGECIDYYYNFRTKSKPLKIVKVTMNVED